MQTQLLLQEFPVKLLRSGTMFKVCLLRGNKAMTFCGRVNFLLCVIISKADHKDLLRYSHYYWSYGTMTLDS